MGYRRSWPGLLGVVRVVLVAGVTAGCVWPFSEGAEPGQDYEQPTVSTSARPDADADPSLERVTIGGSNEVTGAGVNAFLWRAALDTIAFMPLASADPYGGVVITDWRATPDNPNERFKMTVYILDPELRADGIKVAVFRQTLRVSGIWADAAVDPETPTKIENTILSRARQLRLRASIE